MPKYFTTEKAVEFLSEHGIPFSKGTLEIWRHKNKGPVYHKIESKVFYTEKDLLNFMNNPKTYK